METKFYVCPVCGQIITKLKDQNIPVICCGQVMKQLVAGEVEASTEKHIPVCEKNGNVVNVVVGSVEHPMSPEHYIEWICLKTKQTTQIQLINHKQFLHWQKMMKLNKFLHIAICTDCGNVNIKEKL